MKCKMHTIINCKFTGSNCGITDVNWKFYNESVVNFIMNLK